MRLSLIIPCYNSAATIRQCLDSVYALPLPESEFEVIVVNDGSSDETEEIVEEYVTRHANLTLIRHLVNRNLGAARNTGLTAVKGNVIAFVDSDDEVGPGLVSALKMMEEKGLDMVAMRVEKVKENGTVNEALSLPYSQDAVFSGIRLQEEHPFWCSAVWGYLYSRFFIESVTYPFAEGVYYEDTDFVVSHLKYAERMSYSDECGYRVFSNPTAITRSFSVEHVFGYAYLGFRMLSIYEGLEDKVGRFSETILEGGSYNLWRAFGRVPCLSSTLDVRHFYNLLDSHVNRVLFSRYSQPAQYWTIWTRFCIKHRMTATSVAGCFISFGGKGLVKHFFHS